MPDYLEGKIYVVYNSIDNAIYIGSTTQSLSNRLSGHRTDSLKAKRKSAFNEAMRLHGPDNFSIKLHHYFVCNSKKELEAEEYKTMTDEAAAGSNLLNSLRDGKHSKQACAKMSGELNHNFNSGCICYQPGVRPIWRFTYWKEGKQRFQSWAVKKHGFWAARSNAQARKAQFPNCQKRRSTSNNLC